MAKYSPVWLNEHHALVDYTDIANAPSKDFYHVFVTPKEVVSFSSLFIIMHIQICFARYNSGLVKVKVDFCTM